MSYFRQFSDEDETDKTKKKPIQKPPKKEEKPPKKEEKPKKVIDNKPKKIIKKTEEKKDIRLLDLVEYRYFRKRLEGKRGSKSKIGTLKALKKTIEKHIKELQ